VTEQDIAVLPRQMDFLMSEAPECMYSGAVGAGKTRILCLKTVMRATHAGARELLIRKTLTSLKGTTLKTLLEGDGDMPPILPPYSYTHNRSEKYIRIPVGDGKRYGEIIYLPMVNDGEGGTQQRIGSYNGSGANIDEAIELDSNDYLMAASRCRIQIAGVPNQVNCVTNPATPSHFLAKQFAPPGSGYSQPQPGCVCFTSPTTDNFFLPKSYIDSMNRRKGSLWYRRMVEGFWCAAEGLIYDRFDRRVHCTTRPMSDFKEFVVGIDQGFSNPFVALLLGIDGDDRIHICAEEYHENDPEKEEPWKVAQKIQAVKRVCELTAGGAGSVTSIVVDPSAAELIAELSSHDLPGKIARKLPVGKATNTVLPGIQAVEKRLDAGPDGKPRLTVEESRCPNTVREFESYQWKKDRPKDEPDKKWDHAMDAMRYGVMEIDSGFKPMVGLSAPPKPMTRFTVATPQSSGPAWDDDRGWTRVR